MAPTLPADIAETTVDPADRPGLRSLLDSLVRRYDRADAPAFLRDAPGLGAALPLALHERLFQMRELDDTAALVVRGGPVGDGVPPTPGHWQDRVPGATRYQDFWLTLLASQLGEPVCWSTLQGSRLLGDVLPIKGEEEEQTGHGSATELAFHVEDAFHDRRCDLLALLTLRNVDRVPTTLATTGSLDLAALDLDVLFEPRFLISPDPEHLRGLPAADRPQPRLSAVLHGRRDSPALRVDPAFTRAPEADPAARRAFDGLCAQLADRLVPVEVPVGDVLLINNHRAVHGRRPFRARYDGTDRWLRKATVLRELSHPDTALPSARARVLNPF
ncbi:TauD/TfdA family dioxygenase [Kitasatospora sp. NPDC101801]|uniref:TauD/TfdA family dioxygenase n=1 Tax=Kitasatospora sp. NPDC101801 TaxID=3364103 RepID=UPI00381C1180